MNIDFAAIEPTVIPQFKGGVGNTVARMFNDGAVKILDGRLEPGATIGLHTHETSSEVIFITAGHGYMLCDGQREELVPGACHYCPKGHSHHMVNDGTEDLAFLAVVPEQ